MKLSRRDFVKCAGAAAAASASLALPAGSAAAAPQPAPHAEGPDVPPGKRPNFLIILCDQMRYPTGYESEALKNFRRDYLPTQNLLRANGLEFTRHYTATSACVPSRTSLITGHYPSLHGASQTYAAAKEACDPDVFWLDPNTVPTVGNYFRAAGYRTYWKGKWHVSHADLKVPGTHNSLSSLDQNGERDPAREALYEAADRLGPYGFAGWVGPEPHGADPLLATGSSAPGRKGRDAGYAAQTVELIQQLDHDQGPAPWLVVCSFVNPHDIGVFSDRALNMGIYDFSVDKDVPDDLFLSEFQDSHGENLTKKPSVQKSYVDSYGSWLGAITETTIYQRFYYQVHKNLDQEMGKVMTALLNSRFRDETIVVFASDHGEMLASHGDMHQKMYQAYEETTHVPLIVWSPRLFKKPRTVEAVTSHIDLAPTLLGLAGIDREVVRQQLARDHSDALPMVGRDLSGLILGQAGAGELTDPVYFMTEDDPNRGLHMGDPRPGKQGITRPPVQDPRCVETVIARLDGAVWKYSRYYDSPQHWTEPGEQDVLLWQKEPTPAAPGSDHIDCAVTVKDTAVADQYELYNLADDPMELSNLYSETAPLPEQGQMAKLLEEQRTQKRLKPASGVVPGQ